MRKPLLPSEKREDRNLIAKAFPSDTKIIGVIDVKSPEKLKFHIFIQFANKKLEMGHQFVYRWLSLQFPFNEKYNESEMSASNAFRVFKSNTVAWIIVSGAPYVKLMQSN